MKALSPKRIEIIKRQAEGQPIKQIAAELGLAQKTTEWHLKVIHEQLGLNNVALLTQYALKNRIANWVV